MTGRHKISAAHRTLSQEQVTSAVSSGEATEPVHRSSGEPADPGQEPGGHASGGADDPVGEAAGGGGGGRRRRPGSQRRGLAAYLLYPRPDTWAKIQIAPACFVLAAWPSGRLGHWPTFVVLWVVLEFLIYPARYQWNDIRGIDVDQAHAERDARARLPVGPTERSRRRSIRLSLAAAAARVLVALLVGVLAGLARPVLILTAAVFAAAGLYEWLRASGKERWPAWRVIAVWLAVGLGYLVRGGLGLAAAGLPWGSTAMITGLIYVTALGIMFVLLTWVLEAASYCGQDAGGGWHTRAGLAAKPHLAELLRSVSQPVVNDGLAAESGRYCGTDPVLRGGSRLVAPWNLALAVAAASAAPFGLALAHPAGPGACLIAAGVGLAGAVLLARCRSTGGRWAIAGTWFGVLIAAGRPTGAARAILPGLPWLAVAGLYCAFCGWSYRDLVTASPRLPPALRLTGRQRPSGV
jgi:hypothetical protein